MTTLSRLHRALFLSALGLAAAGGASAQSWDLDACVAVGGTNCTSAGSTVTVTGWYTNGASTAFTQGTMNIGGGWTGVKSKDGSGNWETTSNNNHAIDNLSSSGATYAEAVYLSFSKAVDVSNITATWAQGGDGYGDFQLWRWNNSSAAPVGGIGGYNPNAMTGWTSVTTQTGDFGDQYSQNVSDGTFHSSHWLVTTKFGGTNDAFKLGQLTATGVCAGANQTGSGTSGGLCANTPPNQTPEPATLAMVMMAVAGAAVARRRRSKA
jgi:PEP-CTERM motif